MAGEDEPPQPSGSKSPGLRAAQATEMASRALDILAELHPTLSPDACDMISVQLGAKVARFHEAFLNGAHPEDTKSHPSSARAEHFPRATPSRSDKIAPLIAKANDTANRLTKSRFFDEVVLLRILRSREFGDAVIFEEIRSEFINIGYGQTNGALRTRLSRLRKEGLIDGVTTDSGKKLAGNYRLSNEGLRIAQTALDKRQRD